MGLFKKKFENWKLYEAYVCVDRLLQGETCPLVGGRKYRVQQITEYHDSSYEVIRNEALSYFQESGAWSEIYLEFLAYIAIETAIFYKWTTKREDIKGSATDIGNEEIVTTYLKVLRECDSVVAVKRLPKDECVQIIENLCSKLFEGSSIEHRSVNIVTLDDLNILSKAELQKKIDQFKAYKDSWTT